jgi:sulfur carrier protein ThiS adenylyltransferase
MAGWADTNLIKTRKVFRNFYVCGDEQNEIKDNLPLMAARVSVCAGHQANKVIQLILEEGDEYDYDK